MPGWVEQDFPVAARRNVPMAGRSANNMATRNSPEFLRLECCRRSLWEELPPRSERNFRSKLRVRDLAERGSGSRLVRALTTRHRGASHHKLRPANLKKGGFHAFDLRSGIRSLFAH